MADSHSCRHASADKIQTDVISDGIPEHKDDIKASQNQQAFSANQDIVATEVKESDEDNDPATAKPQQDEKSYNPQSDSAAINDTEMIDAPTKSPTVLAEETVTEVKLPVVETSSLTLVPESSAQHDTDSPASSAFSPGTKEDVVMCDAQPPPPTDVAQSTQDTALSDAPLTPAGEANSQTVAPSIRAAETSPAAPVTADTSMSEPSQSTTKVSRERDIDSEDEPVAKRAKVEPSAEQVEVKATPVEDKMDVDRPDATATSLFEANGEPKNLADDSLNSLPITDYMSKQIRNTLAGVKKTKAGANFRLSVQALWPGLWNDYSAKVKNPTDISQMEKKLRGELPRYKTMGEFKSDLELLVQNSMTFNGEVHEVTQSAKATRDTILQRMALQHAVEPAKPEKKETAKQHPTRHAEPRTTAQPPPPAATAAAATAAAAPRRPSKGAATSPPAKPAVESPAFAIPANNNGVPLIRRDSTKPDSRTKRPVKPAHSKDLVYDTKRKKKLSPELRFCEEVLNELRKGKYYEFNAAFMQPVDPVALNIPSYHKVVKKPMDLQTMSTKLGAGEYTSAKEFEKDFDLIVKNCKLFNGEDHVVFEQALRLQQLFRKEFSKKDEWMARHAPAIPAPPSRATTSPAPKDESEEDGHESDTEPGADEEIKASQHRLATIQKRLEEEQKKVNDMINAGTAEMADVEIAQSVVNMLQKQLMGERAKLASLQTKKPAKPKPAKSKKSGGASGASRKSDGNTAKLGGAGPSKKSGGPKRPPKRKIGALEKDIIATGIAELDGKELERAIDIIKRDTGTGENDSGELELDIEQLSEEALGRLYDISIKAFPHLRAEKEKNFVVPPQTETPPARSKAAAAKSKKNKPMSKQEQERRIQQLNELRAQVGRQASGSQEPMESIEGNGNGRGSADPVANPVGPHDSDDEESSEEE